MTLNRESLQNTEFWESNHIELPAFDIQQIEKQTHAAPQWIHFGAGNIFRGFIARLHQIILNAGLAETGIIAAESFDPEIIDKIYAPHDNLSLMVGLKPDGSTRKEIIAAAVEALKAEMSQKDDWSRLQEIFRHSSLQMVSFTITEKGYAIRGFDGSLISIVREDTEKGPDQVIHVMSVVTSLLHSRFLAGGHPIALVSMDNCSHNGEKLKQAVLDIAALWVENNHVDKAFVDYLSDPTRVAWPWTMIDKITPRPAQEIEDSLTEAGISGMQPVITSRNTYIAPFVNAEIPEYLVVEDTFPNGRPPLEKAGVYFADRETVNQTERMKVTTCLNPLHTALAVFGCLLGYRSIADEMKDPDLKSLVEEIGYSEGVPVVTDPKIIRPQDFIREVIEERLPNPYIPDMPQRIATDTSLKVGIRFGETIKAYIADPDLDVQSLKFIPLAIAAWLRYLLAIDDECSPMEISSDPMREELQGMLTGITVGNPESGRSKLDPVLSKASIFGTDLTACGLSTIIEDYFCRMLDGKGAVRKVLQETLRSAADNNS